MMILRERNRYGNMALWYITKSAMSLNEGGVPNFHVTWQWRKWCVYVRLPRWRFFWMYGGTGATLERAYWPGWRHYWACQKGEL
jgi:hypothetical protein